MKAMKTCEAGAGILVRGARNTAMIPSDSFKALHATRHLEASDTGTGIVTADAARLRHRPAPRPVGPSALP